MYYINTHEEITSVLKSGRAQLWIFPIKAHVLSICTGTDCCEDALSGLSKVELLLAPAQVETQSL